MSMQSLGHKTCRIFSKYRFYFRNDSSITATDNSITFSEMGHPFYLCKTVHLKGAKQSQIQRFLDKLPASIKEKCLRKPTRTYRKKAQEQKATLHEEPTREAQQLPSRHEQLQRQKELGEAGLREQLREKENQKQNLETRLMRGKDEQQENLQRQSREKDGQQKNLQRQLKEKDEQQENLQRQLREMEQRPREKDEQQQSLQRQLREKDGQQENLQRQLREKDGQQENLQRQLKEMEKQLRRKDEQQQLLQTQLTETRMALAHCKGQLQENEEQETNLRGQLREKEQQLIIVLNDKEKECAHLRQKLRVKLEELSDLQRELRDREQDNVLLQKDLTAAKETVSKYESQLRTRDWVLSRDEIQLTDNCLGVGGWGRVVKGRYCGCAVAIKQLHQPSLSPRERDLFEREMDIASRCRHPCLLQFIGATQDESPLFVTELMETSLRALLGKQRLSVTEVSVISLDVARALNYLHQRKPKPIVHRDVSSANVLLWKQNNQWRGKVSDYGTAKFLEQIMTSAVGALIYSAPEADSRHNQTVKMDVYSFGVLVCEMFIWDLPDFDRRDEQVARVTNTEFRDLIKWCIEEDPAMRPSMEEVIEKLEQFNGMS